MTTYQEAVRRLQPVIEPVFDALTSGLVKATADHAQAKFRRKDDPHYYLHGVRRTTVTELEAKGLQAIDEGSGGRRWLAMSSILIPYRGLAVKVLHTRDDHADRVILPVPGRSRARQRFWRQVEGSALPGMETDNLILLWRDKKDTLVDTMHLMRPTGGDHRLCSLTFDWVGLFTRSMAQMRAADLDELTPEMGYQQLGDGDAG